MTWDPVWDAIFRKKEWGKYPPEELIRFTATNYYRFVDRHKLKFLDLGCGYGSATWYLCREGFNVTAVDGSKVILQRLKERLRKERLKADLVHGDIVKLPFADGYFDCVVDLYALMCNTLADTEVIVKEVDRVLKRGGRFLSITLHQEDNIEGQSSFSSLGTVRFTKKKEIEKIYTSFRKVTIDHLERSQDGAKNIKKFWVISCLK